MLIVWAGLAGLLPAAAACATEMPARDCCPPGQEMPCEPVNAPSFEQAPCCGAVVASSPSLRVAHERSEQYAADDLSPDLVAIVSAHTPLARAGFAPAVIGFPDRSFALPGSRIYLETARLRL
jgi:hypothetical protein